MLSLATADMRCGSAEPATRRMTAREDRAILEHGVSAFGDSRRLGRASLAPPALAPAGRSRRPSSAIPSFRSVGVDSKRHAVARLRAYCHAPRCEDMALSWSQPVWTSSEHMGRTPLLACRRRERGDSPAQLGYATRALSLAAAPHTLARRRCTFRRRMTAGSRQSRFAAGRFRKHFFVMRG